MFKLSIQCHTTLTELGEVSFHSFIQTLVRPNKIYLHQRIRIIIGTVDMIRSDVAHIYVRRKKTPPTQNKTKQNTMTSGYKYDREQYLYLSKIYPQFLVDITLGYFFHIPHFVYLRQVT